MMSQDHPVFRLVEIMAQLRSPQGGCPWDLEQTFASVAPYTVEEAYEVADAIERGNLGDLKEELGDLLLQVVFHARMAEEQGAFDFGAVAEAINDKMVRRHPHVFGEVRHRSSAEQTEAWETIKAAERAAKADTPATSLLDDVPVGLPALTRAVKLSKRAARVGFVWPSAAEVLTKLHEEVAELEAEVAAGDVDPEAALRGTNAKFIRRFKFIEAELAAKGSSPAASDLAEMDTLWEAAKVAERAG
jgi:tetrapyrrole methylase family protein/MazG family protein/ATP diphosphatase